MFDNIAGVAKGIHAQLVDVYWGLLPLVVVVLIILEFFKDPGQNPDVGRILKRALVSVILLYSLDLFVNTLGDLAQLITSRVNGGKSQWEILKSLGPGIGEGSDEWFSIKSHILYAFSLIAYLVAYIGFFIAEAMTNLVWVVLYSVAPLMLLAHVPMATANITTNLYKGFMKVLVWGLLWQILGRLLLALAVNVNTTGLDDYLMQIVLNLSIGIAMLFIPVFARSLINDGLEMAAGSMSIAPAYAALRSVKTLTKTIGTKAVKGGRDATIFASKPLTNPVVGRVDRHAKKLKSRMEPMKKKYENFGLPSQKQAQRKETPKPEVQVSPLRSPANESLKRRLQNMERINAERQKRKDQR